MCGICGIIGRGAQGREEEVRSMMKALIHRGPDGEGIYAGNNICMGHRRLKIIDLSDRAKQPMTNENEDVIIVYNGEIYNYIELSEELKKKGHHFKSKSDTEVIIHGYEEWGFECLNKFNGMFAFAIFDRKRKHVFLARDRFGIKPLYWTQNGKSLYFASEIKALLRINDIKARPNDTMIFDYIVFARVDHMEDTFFKNIYRLKPGHYMIYKNGKLDIKQWWHLKKPKTTSVDFFDLLKKSVKLRLRSDVPLGSSLSGGLDSSSVMIIMREVLKNKPLHSFSAVYDQSWVKDEGKYVDLLVEKFKLNKNTVTPTVKMFLSKMDPLIYHQEEPFGSPSIFASYKVVELARKRNITVLLNGQGGDEILAGYPYFTTYYLRELLHRLHLYRFFKEIFLYYKREGNLYALKLLFFLGLPSSLKKRALATKVPVLNKNFFGKQLDESRVIEEFLDAPDLNCAIKNHLEHKLEHLLRYEDKNAMAFSIETRLPFLDYNLVQQTVFKPAKDKINNGVQKRALREAMAGILPDQIRLREDKIGFEVPEYNWFQNEEFKKFFKKHVDKNMKTINYYDLDKLEMLIDHYFKGKKGLERLLWRILNLELWYKKFIET
jgi:asparagine synthase (glutamine-hydrolysing)